MRGERYSPKYSRESCSDGGFFGALNRKGHRCRPRSRSTAVQREVFYELVLDHLSGIADLSLAVEQGDFATAERLGIEFGEDLRLMEDLGWDSEPRKDADLTMAPEDLAEILTRLKADAEGGLRESAYGRERQGDRRERQEPLPVGARHLQRPPAPDRVPREELR